MVRRTVVLVDLMFDQCSLSFGTAPCTATGEPCYATFCTCKDTAHYARSTPTTPACRYSVAGQQVPVGITAYPCITGVEHVPTVVDTQRGLGRHDSMTVQFEDFLDYSELTDPYWARRTSKVRASHFAVLKARNIAYPTRLAVVRTGYLDDQNRCAISSMTSQTFVLQTLNGPASGVVSATLVDPMARLEAVSVPGLSAGELGTSMAIGATSATLRSGDGAEYASGQTVRIDDEIMTFDTLVGDAATVVSRALWGTTAAAHDSGAKIQTCRVWSSVAIDTIWYDILIAAGVLAGYIDTAGASAEAALWFKLPLSACISVPTPASDLLSSLMQSNAAMSWWDADSALMRFRGIHPIMPSESIASIDDTANVVGRSVTVEEETEKRLTRANIYYGVIDWSRDLSSPDSYLRNIVWEDPSAESANEYGDVRDTVAGNTLIMPIFAYWMPSTYGTVVSGSAFRYLVRFRDPPKKLTLTLSEKDATQKPGDMLSVTVREVVDATGAPATLVYRVTSRHRVSLDSMLYEYEMESDSTQGGSKRWFFVNTPGCPFYALASYTQRLYGFVCDPVTLKMPDGSAPYCLL